MCCHVDFWGFSVGVGAFVIGLSQISSFFSLCFEPCMEGHCQERLPFSQTTMYSYIRLPLLSDLDFMLLIDKRLIPAFYFWLGSTNLNHKQKWVWVTDGRAVDFTDWDPTEPTHYDPYGNKENCINIFSSNDFTWNDGHCDNKYNYICEKSKL